jgi:hypothetical protein
MFFPASFITVTLLAYYDGSTGNLLHLAEVCCLHLQSITSPKNETFMNIIFVVLMAQGFSGIWCRVVLGMVANVCLRLKGERTA